MVSEGNRLRRFRVRRCDPHRHLAQLTSKQGYENERGCVATRRNRSCPATSHRALPDRVRSTARGLRPFRRCGSLQPCNLQAEDTHPPTRKGRRRRRLQAHVPLVAVQQDLKTYGLLKASRDLCATSAFSAPLRLKVRNSPQRRRERRGYAEKNPTIIAHFRA